MADANPMPPCTPWAMYGAANVVIELWIAATAAAQPGTGAVEHNATEELRKR